MTDAELAHTKELAFWMTERVFMNPISAKLFNEDWRKEFPDEVAVAERMKALVEALEKAQAKNALVAGGIEAAAKLHERIAELESRTVTVKLPPELYTIGELIRTQDNRITDQPMFVVFQKREIIGSDEHSPSRICWVWDGEEVSEDAGPGYIPVYREASPAQPAPVVPDENVSFHRLPGESEYDRLNRQREWMESKSKLAKVTAAAPDDLTERLLRLRAQATLDGSYLDTEEWDSLACDVIKALNACRAAMLQEIQKSAGASNNCRSGENVQDLLAGNCRENRNSSTNNFREIAETSTNYPVIPAGYVMVPKEPTAEMIAAAMNCDDVLFNSDDSFCVQFGNIYEAMIKACEVIGNEKI